MKLNFSTGDDIPNPQKNCVCVVVLSEDFGGSMIQICLF